MKKAPVSTHDEAVQLFGEQDHFDDWSDERAHKYWDSITSGEEHKISACMAKIGSHVSDPGAFCGALASRVGYKAKHEADSGSSFPQATRAGAEAKVGHKGNPKKPHGGQKKSNKVPHPSLAHPKHLKRTAMKQKSEIRFLVHRIREAASEPGKPTKFKVVLIQEGLGNMRDLFYYTRECVAGAASVFVGKKIYADHPDAKEEETRPERSVRDILGYFEECEPIELDDETMALEGTVCTMAGPSYDWANSLMESAVDFSKKFDGQEFVGLSINATGEADEVDLTEFMANTSIPEPAKLKLEKAIAEGATTIRPVSAITDAVSCDLVTEAGAGGKVLALIEQEKSQMKKINKKGELVKSKKAVQESEEGAEENEEDETVTPPPKGKGDDGKGDDGDGGHADADQDKALIKKAMAKHMGMDESEVDEAEAEKAVKAAKSLGYEGEEAMKCAAMHMKMAKKMAAEEAETEEAEDPLASVESEAEADESEKGKNPMEAEIKGLRKENMSLKGRVAALEASHKKGELEKHMDKKLKESGLGMATTKKFRESVKGIKTKEAFDEMLSAFLEGFKQGGDAANSPVTLSVQRVVESDDSDDKGNGRPTLDISRCLR